MYELDLLQGRNLPPRTRPASLAFAGLLVALPVSVAFFTVGPYLEDGTAIPTYRQVLENLSREIGGLAEAQAFLKETERERERLGSQVREVERALTAHAPWSPALVALAQNVPADITISKLELCRESFEKRPGELGTYEFVLRVGAYVPSGGRNSSSIQHLIDRLRVPGALGREVAEARIVLQQPELIEERPYVFYLLECPLVRKG